MSLADRLQSGPPTTMHGLPCSIGVLLDRLDDDERAALDTMMADQSWSAGGIADAVAKEGHGRLSHQMVRKHRRRECRCFGDEP